MRNRYGGLSQVSSGESFVCAKLETCTQLGTVTGHLGRLHPWFFLQSPWLLSWSISTHQTEHTTKTEQKILRNPQGLDCRQCFYQTYPAYNYLIPVHSQTFNQSAQVSQLQKGPKAHPMIRIANFCTTRASSQPLP